MAKLVFALFITAFASDYNVDTQESRLRTSWDERFPSCALSSALLNFAVSQPADGSKLWIDHNALIHRTYPTEGVHTWTDDEQRLLLAVESNSSEWPGGAKLKFFVNGAYIETNSRSVSFSEFGLGEHTVSAVLYIAGGQEIPSCSNSTFVAFRHLEHAYPPVITFSAEEPLDGQMLPPGMEDVSKWETYSVDFDFEADNVTAFLLRRWKDVAGSDVINDTWSAARSTLREYSIFHAEALRNHSSAQRALFLIFRPFPGSGLGNHLLALVRYLCSARASRK
jgi:hypothetical protein